MTIEHLSAPDLAAWLADGRRPPPLLLDVREPWEFALCRLEHSQLMPMKDVAGRMGELDLEAPIVCVCHHGARSMQVAAFLSSRGAAAIHNLSGGLAGWTVQVDPTFPTY